MKLRRLIVALASATILSACAIGGSAMDEGATAAPSSAIAAAVADPARPAEDRARDAARKPGEVVAFAGIKPGDKVADLLPGGGYFTRIFSKVVGPQGRVYAIVSPRSAQRPGGMDGINAVAAAYPNVTVTVADPTSFTVPEPLDVVWTSENYHDLHNMPGDAIASFNRAVFAALKPGGVFFVSDHAAPGTGASATSTLHRIDPELVKQEVQAAGFRLEAESALLADPSDPHTAGATDPSIRGRTDKFALKFRKPR